MDYPKYEITTTAQAEVYEFKSIGIHGEIDKVVQFKELESPGYFNLAFGDKREDGSLNDEAESNNGDMETVLATVASTAYEFTSTYPERKVFFRGRTDALARLYRMAISKNLAELEKDFIIFGVVEGENGLIPVPFVRNGTYVGYIVERRNSTLKIAT